MLLISAKDINLLIFERVKVFLQLMHHHRNDARICELSSPYLYISLAHIIS
jgi:hypothetical protein